jgi:hypothetical protein
MRNFSDKICRENQETHFMINNFIFESRAVYEIAWKNTVETDRPQVTVRRRLIACWITKTTNTHLEHVILIAFPLQQWLHARHSMLQYTYTSVLFVLKNNFSLDY